MASSSKRKPRPRTGKVPARKQAAPARKAGTSPKARAGGAAAGRAAPRAGRPGGKGGGKPRASAKAADGGRSAPALAEVDAEVLEFIAALDRFKQEHGRPFPSWSEVLLVLRRLGYRRQ